MLSTSASVDNGLLDLLFFTSHSASFNNCLIFLQVSMEADFGSEPGYIGVRGIHVVPGYCHPLPLRATKGAVLFSLGHVLADTNIF